jgi:TRAP-type C4-dicarboxylate transport system permease small subunit
MSDIVNPSSASGSAKPDGYTVLDRTVEPLRKAMRRFGLALLIVLILLPSLQVFLRTLVNRPFIGAEELARFILICVVFVTLPYVVSSGASIRMEEIMSILPRCVQWFLRVLITATATAAYGVAAYSVAVATLKNLDNATPTLGIPYWVFFSTAFFGLLFSSIESAVQIVKAFRNRSLYVSFAEEQPPEEPDLERVLLHPPSAGGGA